MYPYIQPEGEFLRWISKGEAKGTWLPIGEYISIQAKGLNLAKRAHPEQGGISLIG